MTLAAFLSGIGIGATIGTLALALLVAWLADRRGWRLVVEDKPDAD